MWILPGFMLLGVAQAVEFPNDQAAAPPLGWNSWNCYGHNITEERVRAQAAAMASSGLRDAGFVYVVMDDGWQGKRGGATGALQGDADFPDMAALSDDVRALGLRLGIYSTPWETSYAGELGSGGYEAVDAWQWALWNVRYLKYDWNPVDAANATRMRDALASTGHPMVYSLSNGVRQDLAPTWAAVSNMWRTTFDITDTWDSMSTIGFGQTGWEDYAGPGGWNDVDMMVLGWVGWNGELHPTGLTPDEQRTHVTLWALLAAPLMLGNDLTRLDADTLALLTNDRVLEVDQDPAGVQASRVRVEGELEVWARPLSSGTVAAGVFNRGEDAADITVRWSDLGLMGAQPVWDLWDDLDLGEWSDAITVTVPAHGAQLLRVGHFVAVPPAFIGPLWERARVGTPFGYTLISTGTRPMAYTATGLPDGLVLDGSLITGVPEQAGTYDVVVEASGQGGDTAEVLTLLVEDAGDDDPQTLMFAADPLVLPPGQGGRLAWSTSGASVVRIDPQPGDVDVSGEALVSLERTTTFVLTAQGDGTASAQTTLTVEVPTGPVLLGLGCPGRLVPTNDAEDWEGWGEATEDSSVMGGPMAVGGVSALHGIGTHADSRIEYALNGAYTWLSASVGLDDEEDATCASVVFSVYGDDVLLWSSDTLGVADGPVPVQVDVRGVSTLALVVDDAGDGPDSDHADWVEPTVLPAPLDDEDTGADTGADTAADDTGDGDTSADPDDECPETTGDDAPCAESPDGKSCGCVAAPSRVAPWWWLGLGLGWRRRRSS